MIDCLALATDYDGTIATHGAVDEATRAGLQRFRATGRKLILVTGRRVEDFLTVYPTLEDFDLIVAENGALIVWPDGREELLGEPPKAEFIAALQRAGVDPVDVGRVIVATFEPHDPAVLETIKTQQLELQVIFNKGAIMILPTGINKATGLERALALLQLDARRVVGVGDAENDHAMLEFCGTSAAVANALPAVKERAKIVLTQSHGAGVLELIGQILAP